MKRLSLRIPLTALVLTLAAVTACNSTPRAGTPPTDLQSRISATIHPALQGTVMEYAALVDAAPIKVEGWGIVAGLPNTGSADMDPRIHELLLNRMLVSGVGLWSAGLQNVSPEDILASPQISAVEVRGVIPPLARKGSTFDLYVNAIPGSGTTSLANGLLWPSELKQIGLTFEGIDSRAIASGQGPMFIPGPLEYQASLANGTKATEPKKALLAGRVIAGGVCLEDRASRLQLYAPNWMNTRLIERAINAHFPAKEKAAIAENDSTISLHIPAEYADHPMDFVDTARHLYLTTADPGVVETKAGQIIEALKDPNAPHRDLGLALQGLGRSILPDYVQPNYTSTNQQLRFWCARAGACLQDVQGLATLQEMVREPANPMRRQALLAMIDASRGRDTERVTVALYDMIRGYNTEDRILAYHALQTIRSRAMLTYKPGRNMFMIDVVPADSPPLIYVLEADSPRIAFIGRDIKLPAGATFVSNDRRLVVRADMPDDSDISLAPPRLVPASAPAAQAKERESVLLHWQSPMGDKEVSLRSVPNLPALVWKVCRIPDPLSKDFDSHEPFIGLSYQRITELLAGMCADKTIDAQFVVERVPDALVSPTDLALSGRPEGLTAPSTLPATQPGPQPAPQR